MNLFKTTLLSIIVTISKVASALALNKVLALFVGPSGYALVGQLQNIITSVTSLASAGVNTGLVKYTSEYESDEEKKIRLWKTAGSMGLIGTAFVSTMLLVFCNQISRYFFLSETFSYLIVLTALFLILYVLNTLLTSIVNGLKDIRRFALITIANSIMSLLITAIFAYGWGLKGALVALVTGQSLVVFVTFSIAVREKWFKLTSFFGKIDKGLCSQLVTYGLVSLATSLLGPVVQSVVRYMIIHNYGINEAGYWDGVSKISNTYLLIITFPLTAYVLPKISSALSIQEGKKYFYEGGYILLPITLFCSLFLYFTRNLVIKLLFTEKFLPMSQLFGWQVVSDFLRVGCWLFAYYLIAKAKIRAFLFAEILVNVVIIILVHLMIKLSFTYVPLAFSISYLLYFLGMALFFRLKIFNA